MNHVYKSIFTTLILTLALNSSFGRITDTIELSLNHSTGELSDPGTTYVYKGDVVFWKIKLDENIRSFNIVGVGHPFSADLPNSNDYFYWIKRKVRHDGPYYWKYKIKYKLKTGRKLELDPKIAVKPNPFTLFTPLEVIFLLAFIVTSIMSILFYRNWQKERNLPKIKGEQQNSK